MSSMLSGKFKSYWKKTSAAEALLAYIDIDEDGLLVHLGYLAYTEEEKGDGTGTARIPNKEVLMEFNIKQPGNTPKCIARLKTISLLSRIQPSRPES